MLVGLRRDIPKLEVRESARTVLYLQVNVLPVPTVGGEEGFCVVVLLKMFRPVTIQEDVGVGEVFFTAAPVWHSDSLLFGSRRIIRQLVKDSLDEKLTEFAADYYRQNP
jgi:hypothetical protein